MNNKFNLCPMCGSKKIECLNNRKWFCPDCNFDLYNNVAASVAVIICDTDGSVLFETRAKEPQKGFLALPGGFCNPNESAEKAASRECKEETGLIPKNLSYIGSFPNTYEYKKIVYKTCDIFFSATVSIPVNTTLLQIARAQQNEVTTFVTKKITSKEDVDSLPLAFKSANAALKLWLKKI